MPIPRITEITQYGLVVISIEPEIEQITKDQLKQLTESNAIQISIIPSQDSMDLKREVDYDYKWDFIEISKSQIQIQVTFTTPANISSSSEPDRLRIKFEHTAEFFRKA